MGVGILTWIVVGLVAGWLEGQYVRRLRARGHIVLGIVSAYIGGLILWRDLMVTGFPRAEAPIPIQTTPCTGFTSQIRRLA